jgi:4a-hydroxytetrahydrobiopterin dehydratase
MPELLEQSEIEEKLDGLTGWEKDGDTITRTFEFKDFIESMEFVNKLVNPAETMNHHPDITISYNTVTLSLTTHSEGGLTENDFELAGQINTIK